MLGLVIEQEHEDINKTPNRKLTNDKRNNIFFCVLNDIMATCYHTKRKARRRDDFCRITYIWYARICRHWYRIR